MTKPTPPAPALPPASENPRETAPSFIPTPRQVFLLLAAYFALQVVVRVTFSNSIDLDESEAVVLTQKLSLGYGSDPPLYMWIQRAFFSVFGVSVLGLSLLKNLLLLSTYLLTFATARLVTRSPAAAVAAALSVFYMPSISWESQRDLTHSVLSTTLSVTTLFCLLKLYETRRLKWYLLFGLAAGFGCISKYNYTLWLFGLAVAGFLVEGFRPALVDRRLLLSAGVVALIFLPNALWMLNHRHLTLLNASKFEVTETLSWMQAAGEGLKNIVQSVISFASPLAIIYALVFLKRPAEVLPSPAKRLPHRRLLFSAWTVIATVLVLVVVFAHATGFRERWFQPILIPLPIAAVLLVQNRLEPWRLKCIAALSLLVMLAVTVAMPGRLLLAERLKREEPLTRPYARLAGDLRSSVPPGSLLICDTQILAGNLRLGLLDTTTLNLPLLPLFPGNYPHCFLVWDARQNASVPDKLRQWAVTHYPARIAPAEPHYLAERYRYHSSKQFRLGYLQLY